MIDRLDLMLEHADLIRQRIDFPFDHVSLIHLALERYAERFDSTAHGSGSPKPFSALTVAQTQIAGVAEVVTKAAPETLGETAPEADPAPGDFITRPNRGSASGYPTEDDMDRSIARRMLSEPAPWLDVPSAAPGQTAAPDEDAQIVGWRPTRERPSFP